MHVVLAGAEAARMAVSVTSLHAFSILPQRNPTKDQAILALSFFSESFQVVSCQACLHNSSDTAREAGQVQLRAETDMFHPHHYNIY